MTDAAYPDDPTPHVEVTERFALVPEPLLYDPDICAEAVRVYAVLRRHGSDPTNCYPSHRRLAELIGKSPRSIQGWLRQLDDAGWIDRVARTTPSGDPDSNGYRVHGRAQERGVRAGERGGVRAAERGGYAPESAPKESNGKRASSNENALALALVDAPTSFDDFWNAYPYKRGSKAAAERAWRAATRVAPPHLIVAGARRFAADPNLPPKDEQRFVRHASTWLRDRGWSDGPLPPRGRPAGAAPAQQQLDAARDDAGQWVLVDGEWRLSG